MRDARDEEKIVRTELIEQSRTVKKVREDGIGDVKKKARKR